MGEQEPGLEQPETKRAGLFGVQRQVTVGDDEPPDDGPGKPLEALVEDAVALGATRKLDPFRGGLRTDGDVVTLRPTTAAVHVARVYGPSLSGNNSRNHTGQTCSPVVDEGVCGTAHIPGRRTVWSWLKFAALGPPSRPA